MTNNKLIFIAIIIILIIGGLLIFKNKLVAPENIEVNNYVPISGNDVEEMVVENVIEDNVKEIKVDATSFSFSPSTITVEKGDTVKITVKNINGTHDLKIDEFNLSTRILKVGEEQTITFVADNAGTFQYYCSIGNHRAMGMVGNLIVR